MKLSSLLSPDLIQRLRDVVEKKQFPGISFKHAMEFILTDGILPADGLPAKEFLKLEDWVRAQGERENLAFSTTDLKNKTGAILEKVLMGKTVTLLRHGRPIAEIRPKS